MARLKKTQHDQKYFLDACMRINAGYIPGGDRLLTYWSGIEIAKTFEALAKPQKSDLIVDLGCGNGRLAMGLYVLGYRHYIGLEIIPQCVDFCKKTFASETGYQFIQLENTNKHYYKGKLSEELVHYPIEDHSVDLVAAFSFFSHTGEYKVAIAHINEIRRILKPGGKLFSTWFFGEETLDEQRTIYNQEKIDSILATRGAQTVAQDSLHGVAGHNQTIWVSAWQN